jgi:hypothetical protein
MVKTGKNVQKLNGPAGKKCSGRLEKSLKNVEKNGEKSRKYGPLLPAVRAVLSPSLPYLRRKLFPAARGRFVNHAPAFVLGSASVLDRGPHVLTKGLSSLVCAARCSRPGPVSRVVDVARCTIDGDVNGKFAAAFSPLSNLEALAGDFVLPVLFALAEKAQRAAAPGYFSCLGDLAGRITLAPEVVKRIFKRLPPGLAEEAEFTLRAPIAI